ncbi:MAG: dioxygenase, partial [Thermoplasmata archaeon]
MTSTNPRVQTVVNSLLTAVRAQLVEHKVTHAEYHAAVMHHIGMAEAHETPLLLDVFFESTVERSDTADRPGSEGTVQGPYYVANPPLLERPYVLSMRSNEPGDACIFRARVLDVAGKPIRGAELDMWQAGNDGTYSSLVGDAPPYNLRGRMMTDEDGAIEVRTIVPAPYQIPNKGPTGHLLNLIGRHSWRPAHFHFFVGAPGFQRLTTQVYLAGGDWLDSDCVGGVKDS